MDGKTHDPIKQVIKVLRSVVVPINKMPVIKNLTYTQGVSYSYINTMNIPVTVVDRTGMRQVVYPVKTQSEYHEDPVVRRNLNELSSSSGTRYNLTSTKKIKEVKEEVIQESPEGALYIVKQYAVGKESVGDVLRYFKHLHDKEDEIKSWHYDADGKRKTVFRTDIIQEICKLLVRYVQISEQGRPREEFTGNAVDKHLGNCLFLSEFERTNSVNIPNWDVDARSHSLRNTIGNYAKLPVVFRVDYDEFRKNDLSLYDEQTDLVFSLLDIVSAPNHPYDNNIHPPQEFGSFYQNSVGFNQLNEKIAKELKDRDGRGSYRYVVDMEAHGNLPPTLYVQSIKGKVNRLVPYNTDEFYKVEGVYITYTYWDEKEKETKYEAEVIPLDDISKLEEFGVFDSISAAKSLGEHKTKTTFDESRITLESKLRKDEYKAKLEMEKAILDRLEAEIRKKKEEQRGFWDGIKNTLSTSWPYIVSIFIGVAGAFFKTKLAAAS